MMKTVPSLTGAAARLWKWTALGEETTKKEGAGDVSMQDKEQNEQTEAGILSKEVGDTSMHDKKHRWEQVPWTAASVWAAEQSELHGSAPKQVLEVSSA